MSNPETTQDQATPAPAVTAPDHPINDEMVIEWIHPNLIYDHPEHEPRFGIATVDDDFVNSIRDAEILQPLIVTTRRLEGEHAGLFCLIAGRRRKLGNAAAFGPDAKLPCWVKEYASDAEEVFDLIVTNKHRKQSERQEVMQIEYAIDTLSDRAKERQTQGLKGKEAPCGGNPPHGEVGRVRAVVAGLFNISEDRVRCLIAVWSDREREAFFGDLVARYDEVLRKQPSKFKPDFGGRAIASITTRWDEIRAERVADHCSLSKAAKMISQLREEALAQVAPKKGAADQKTKMPAFPFPARTLAATETFSPFKDGELASKESIAFGVIESGGEVLGAAIMLRGRAVVLPWERLFDAYVRPQLPAIPLATPPPTPLEEAIAEASPDVEAV